MKNATKKIHNPFVISGFNGRKYFCDREDELAQLLENVNNGRNTVLHAWRRLGKTALIHLLINELEESEKWETVYIDLLGTHSTDEAIKAIIKGVYEKFGKTSNQKFGSSLFKLFASLGVSFSLDPLTGFPTIEANYKPQSNLAASISEVGQFLSQRKKKVLLVFDEFQQITRYKEEGNCEAIFRSFMQENPTVRMIFSGSERNLIGSMFLDPTRPFYKSCSLMPLEPIELNRYSDFIQEKFKQDKKQISIAVIHEMYDWSRGQTYSVQLLCNRMYSMLEENTIEKLSSIKQHVLNEEAPVFSNFSNLLTITQWKVLKAIAKSEPLENPQASEFINKHQLGAASSVSTALKMLLDKEIVIKDGKLYLVHDVQFSRWLQSL